MEQPAVRDAFLAEMADVLMYYHDILLRYHISPEEISRTLVNKQNADMYRDYAAEYKEQYNG